MYRELFFYVVFLSQVLLLSWYFPRRLLGQMQFVRDTYPPESYPKLYPKSADHYQQTQQRFSLINNIVLLAGLALLAWFATSTRSGEWDHAFVTWYFLLQAFPVILLDLRTLKHMKLMRLANQSNTRSASLQPRRLFDFVSPWLVALAAVVYVAFCLFIVYMNSFDFEWFGGYLNIVIVTGANLFFGSIGWWFLRGKKLDPHQSPEDRHLYIERIIKVLVLVSIAMTLYASFTITLAAFEMRELQPISISIYYQILILLTFQAYRIDGRNFEVYKADPSVS